MVAAIMMERAETQRIMVVLLSFLLSASYIPPISTTGDSLIPDGIPRKPLKHVIYTPADVAAAEKEFGRNLTEALNRLEQDLKSGVPELGIPVLDPMKVQDIELTPIIGSDVFSVKLKDIKIKGLSNFKLQNIEPSLFRLQFPVSVHYPLIQVESQYSANGSIFNAFEVAGGGPTTLEFHDVHARTTVYMRIDNDTFELRSADHPLLDFRTLSIRVQGKEVTSKGKLAPSGMAEQIAPILFWMLSHKIIKQLEYPMDLYLNDIFRNLQVSDAIKEIHRPIDFYLLREITDILRPPAHRIFAPPSPFRP